MLILTNRSAPSTKRAATHGSGSESTDEVARAMTVVSQHEIE